MNRSAALSRLTIRYRDLADDTGWSEQELADSFGLAIDDALRLLDYEETALASADVPQARIKAYLAALDYTALQAFADAASVRVATSVPGPTAVQSQQAFAQISARLEKAEQALQALGIDPTGEQSMSLGRLTLDFLEPGCSTDY